MSQYIVHAEHEALHCIKALDPGTVVVRRRRRRQGLGPTPVVKLTVPDR